MMDENKKIRENLSLQNQKKQIIASNALEFEKLEENFRLEFDAKLKSVWEKIDMDNGDYDDLFCKISTLENNIGELTEKLELEKEKCKEVQSRCDEVTKRKEKLEKQVEAGEATVKTKEQKLIDLGKRHQIVVEILNSRISSLDVELKNSIENVILIIDANSALQSDKERITLTNKEQLSQVREKLRATEETVTSLTGDNRKLDREVKRLTILGDCLQMEMIKKETSEKLHSESSNAMKLEFEAEHERLQTKINDLEGKVKESYTKLQDKTTELNKISKQLLQWKTKFERKFDEVKEAKKQQKNSDKNIAQLTEEKRDLERSLHEYENESIQYQKKIEGLSNEKTELERKLELKSSSEQDLKDSYDRKKLRIQINNEEIKVLKSKVDLLEKRVDEKQDIIQMQETELKIGVERAEDLCKHLQAAQERRSNNQLSQLDVHEVKAIDDDDDEEEDDVGPSTAKKPRRGN